MGSWLKALGIATVAMESTGVYWVAIYEVLEAFGIEVIVANAREARAVPGRKSDVNDAQWLQRLHACGLLRASFPAVG
jgi:transposase